MKLSNLFIVIQLLFVTLKYFNYLEFQIFSNFSHDLFLFAHKVWRRDKLLTPVFLGFPGGLAGKESSCSAEDLGSIPGLGRSPGGGEPTHSSVPGLPWWLSW